MDRMVDQVLQEDYLKHKGTFLFSLLILIGLTNLKDLIMMMFEELYPDDECNCHHHCYITAIYGNIQGFKPVFRHEFKNFKVQ
jgi:hypothetical protein